MVLKTLFLLLVTCIAIGIVLYGVYLLAMFIYNQFVSDHKSKLEEIRIAREGLQQTINEVKGINN